MVATTTTQPAAAVRGGLRSMDPARDLKEIADLIATAFSQRLNARGQAALRELRWMARLWPFVAWWAQADPAFREAFNGFVWEKPAARGNKRQVVGNVSLNRAPGSRQHWIICNVVVRKDHRRQGIARKLTEAAMNEVEKLEATGILIQVYQDNQPALHLYTDLGFKEVAGEIDMQLDAVRAVAVLDAPGYQFRPWKSGDGSDAYSLACRATAQALQWLRPIRSEDYRLDWGTRLGEWFAALLKGQRLYRLAVLQEERLVATMTLKTTYRRGHHHLELLIDPDHRGQLEAVLVSRALHMLAAAPPRPIKTTVDKGHRALVKTLRSYGFQEQSTLLTLQRSQRTGE